MDENTQNTLINQIQIWTKQIPLLVLGSGASVPFGLPTMFSLGEYLKKSISLTNLEEVKEFESFKDELNRTQNLEEAISNVSLSPNIHNLIIKKTWELINKQDIIAYYKLIKDIKNFPLANLIKFLHKGANNKISILTTNYDRLAEYASCFNDLYIYNGFAQNYHGKFLTTIPNTKLQKDFTSNLVDFGYNGKINIWKVHGSIDWFQSNSNDILHIPINNELPSVFNPIIITPGKEKYQETHLEPYRTIIQKSDNEITNANSYLSIGYGFNDTHIQEKLIREIKTKDKPIIVLARNLTQKTKDLIIDSCKNYILFEECITELGTIVHSSLFAGEKLIKNKSYWSLDQYLEIIQ